MYDLYPEKLNEKTVLYCIGYRCFNGHQPLCQRKKATPPQQPLPLRPKPQNPLPPLCRILTASATPNPPATRVMKTAIPMPPNRPATANSPTAKPLPSSRPLKRLRKSTPTKLPATTKPSLTTKQLPRRRHPLRPRLSRQQNNRVTLGKKMLSKRV